MKNWRLITTLAGLTLAGCCTTPHGETWEYKVVRGQVHDTLEGNINNAAAEGWQVVSASKYGGDGDTAFVVMRRLKKAE